GGEGVGGGGGGGGGGGEGGGDALRVPLRPGGRPSGGRPKTRPECEGVEPGGGCGPDPPHPKMASLARRPTPRPQERTTFNDRGKGPHEALREHAGGGPALVQRRTRPG